MDTNLIVGNITYLLEVTGDMMHIFVFMFRVREIIFLQKSVVMKKDHSIYGLISNHCQFNYN